MRTRIQTVNVHELGPIKHLQRELGALNVIFSPNERGKTYLVEFIIRSLFRNHQRWPQLRAGGGGKVGLEGLSDQMVYFSPSSSTKLEDYWQGKYDGMPVSISDLIVAKGAEVTISRQGISQRLLKEVLSGINELEEIGERISKTIQTADITEGHISISKKGEGKTYKEKQAERKHLNALLEEVESKYATGIIQDYQNRLKTVQEQIDLQHKARRHQAYLISKKLQALEAEMDAYPEEEIQTLEQDIRAFEDARFEHERKQQQLEKASFQSRHKIWLEKIRQEYREWLFQPAEALHPFYYIIPSLGATASLVFLLINLNIPAMISLLATLGSGVYLMKRIHKKEQNRRQQKEIEIIRNEFRDKTGKNLTHYAVLEEELELQAHYAQQVQFLGQELEQLDQKLNGLEQQIRQKFKNFTGHPISPENWGRRLSEIKETHRQLNRSWNEERDALMNLGVNPTDFLPEDPGVVYRKEQIMYFQEEFEEIKQTLNEQENQLSTLKQRICDVTDDNLLVTWNDLIPHLREKKEQVERELKKLAAKIVAGKMIYEEIEQARKEEDAKIQEGLRSPFVTEPLYQLTRRYTGLSMDAEKNLVVSDPYYDFLLSELSTGAKEQVMLALRIGFSRKLLNRDAMFLILDDAFQHSDWMHREVLIRKLAEISKMGWQIIYCTMDNHIYDLFCKAGQQPGIDFKAIEL